MVEPEKKGGRWIHFCMCVDRKISQPSEAVFIKVFIATLFCCALWDSL